MYPRASAGASSLSGMDIGIDTLFFFRKPNRRRRWTSIRVYGGEVGTVTDEHELGCSPSCTSPSPSSSSSLRTTITCHSMSLIPKLCVDEGLVDPVALNLQSASCEDCVNTASTTITSSSTSTSISSSSCASSSSLSSIQLASSTVPLQILPQIAVVCDKIADRAAVVGIEVCNSPPMEQEVLPVAVSGIQGTTDPTSTSVQKRAREKEGEEELQILPQIAVVSDKIAHRTAVAGIEICARPPMEREVLPVAVSSIQRTTDPTSMSVQKSAREKEEEEELAGMQEDLAKRKLSGFSMRLAQGDEQLWVPRRRSWSYGAAERRLRAEAIARARAASVRTAADVAQELAVANAAARQAAAAAMASAAATNGATSSATQLGMPTGSAGSSSVAGSSHSTSQMAGSQLSPMTPRQRELRELQQVERIRTRLERELKEAANRENEIRDRTIRLETVEADKTALEAMDESTMNDDVRVLRSSLLSLHAHVDRRMDFMQDTLDQILAQLQQLGPRLPTVARSSLPMSAMIGTYPHAGTQPSGSSAATSQTVASTSSGPAVAATPPPQQQSVPPQGQQQGPWYPKTPMKPPVTFFGEKKDEELNTWLRTVPMWVRAKRTLQEEEVITAASYLEGKATKWLDGIIAKAGFGRRMADWAKTMTLDEFIDMVEARWHNPQQAQIATDTIIRLDQRWYKSVRELTTTVENLIVVPGICYDDQVLLTMFVRCLPENLRTQLASEARLEYHTFASFSRKALDLEATLGSAQPTTPADGTKKKSPQEWKKKGSKVMMVESDGTQTEIEELTDLLDNSEYDGEEIAEGSTLAAVVKAKAGGRGKGHQKSQGQAASNQTKVADWVKAGLDQDVWRDRRVRGACINCGNHPEANGQAEQMNRVVQDLLRHYIKPSQDDWDEKLPLIAILYNNAVHSSTDVSPNQLRLGWKPRSALDFLLPENRPSATPGTFEYGVQYEKLLQQAVEHIKKAQQAMIAYENKHRRQSTFQVGERVWVKASELGQEFGISRKLMPQYFGPWEVLDIVGDEMDGPTYVIRIPGHLRTHPVFHASKLAPFAETDQFPSRRSMLPPTMDGQVDIDDIVDHRDLPVPKPLGRGRPPKPKREYRVRFRHHTDPKEDGSFTREELTDTTPQVVAEYERMLKGKAPAK
ncbi:hypothetical protein CBR_g23676 [Chara braunii]|uniref:Integrase catalytic domain-containing protein n=1 Tax=Chara braunii TaxID=69332 RepID=A0A388L4W4_CHABU|nr:hypothetical protein CBR_g23676 [Chara braunii]|eukprot:GBG77344.1 hypothetical protein CBR_g23676 [Chara braunii]